MKESKMLEIKRNEVWCCNFGNTFGSEQYGYRPCLVVQNNRGNEHGNTTMVCPITTNTTSVLPTHVKLNNLKYPSVVMCEQVKSVDKRRLIYKISEIKGDEIKNVNRALRISLEL